MADNKTTKYDLKFWLTLMAEVFVAFVIFIALSEWQVSDMLPTDSQVPVITSPTLTDESVTFPQATSDGPTTLVYFFAPWCTVCHFSIENLNTVASQYPDVQILIVALDYQSVEEIKQFMADHDLPFTIVIGDRRWADAYQIKGFPSYYIISPDGAVLSRSMGYSSTVGMLARLNLSANAK